MVEAGRRNLDSEPLRNFRSTGVVSIGTTDTTYPYLMRRTGFVVTLEAGAIPRAGGIVAWKCAGSVRTAWAMLLTNRNRRALILTMPPSRHSVSSRTASTESNLIRGAWPDLRFIVASHSIMKVGVGSDVPTPTQFFVVRLADDSRFRWTGHSESEGQPIGNQPPTLVPPTPAAIRSQDEAQSQSSGVSVLLEP